MSDSNPKHGYRMKRRQFLANLLFAGGALTLAGLQSAEAAEAPTDDWTLPDLSQNDPRPFPTPPPQQPPKPPPQPPTAGVPVPAGGIKPPPPPQPKGAVVRQRQGDPAPAKPKSK